MQPSRVHIPAGAPNTRWPKSIHRVARGLTVTTVDQPSPGWRSDTRSGWISSPTYIFRQSTQQQWEMVVLPATSWTALYPLTETKARSIGILLEWVGISPEVRVVMNISIPLASTQGSNEACSSAVTLPFVDREHRASPQKDNGRGRRDPFLLEGSTLRTRQHLAHTPNPS